VHLLCANNFLVNKLLNKILFAANENF